SFARASARTEPAPSTTATMAIRKGEAACMEVPWYRITIVTAGLPALRSFGQAALLPCPVRNRPRSRPRSRRRSVLVSVSSHRARTQCLHLCLSQALAIVAEALALVTCLFERFQQGH